MYTALLAFSLATGVGCVALVVRKCRVSRVECQVVERQVRSFCGSRCDFSLRHRPPLPAPPSTRFRRWSLGLLGLSALLTLGVYVSYNVIFVQPQGRYLFPALPAIALAVALGWQEVVSRPAAACWAGVVVLATAGLAGLIGVLRLGVNKWSVAILGGAGLALAGWSLGIPRVSGPWRARPWLWPLDFPLSRFPCSISTPFPRSSYHSWDRPSSTLFSSKKGMMHSQRDRLCEHLQRVPYFAGLDAAALCELASLATWHEYAPGAVIFLEGDVNTGLYAVQEGWVKVVKFSLDGREQVLRYFGPGEFFSEIGIFLAWPNPATAMTLERTALWRLHRSTLSRCSAHSPLCCCTSWPTWPTVSPIWPSWWPISPCTRWRCAWPDCCWSPRPTGALERQAWLTQAELAMRLGTVPDVLSRALRILADGGLIRFDRRQITILDRPGLLQRAQLAP